MVYVDIDVMILAEKESHLKPMKCAPQTLLALPGVLELLDSVISDIYSVVFHRLISSDCWIILFEVHTSSVSGGFLFLLES